MASTLTMDPYAVLEIPKDATLSKIKAAHRKQVRKYNPDRIKNKIFRRHAQNKLQQVQQAYEVLSGPFGVLASLLDSSSDSDSDSSETNVARQKQVLTYYRNKTKHRIFQRRSRDELQQEQEPFNLAEWLNSSESSSSSSDSASSSDFEDGPMPKYMRHYKQRMSSRPSETSLSSQLSTRRRGPSFREDMSSALSGGTDRHHTSRKSVQLPVYIRRFPVMAIPDTGSEVNAISMALATEIGLDIKTAEDAEPQVSFQLANGRSIRSVGIASSFCSFGRRSSTRPPARPPIEPPTKASKTSFTRSFLKSSKRSSETPSTIEGFSTVFNVFPNLAVPLIIGRRFLEATETLTKYADRLYITEICAPISLPRILHMNHPQQRLRCYLNVNLVYANADTGAEMNLVSPQFAAQRGFQIEKPDPQNREVVLADGSCAPISGQFRARFDTFTQPPSETRRPQAHEKMFYILDGLTTDVLLSKDLLFEISAFSDHGSSFVDLDGLGISCDLNLVVWLSKLEKRLIRQPSQTSGSNTDPCTTLEVTFQLQLDNDDAKEQYTRQTADREIARLAEPEKSKRQAEEVKRRQRYDATREKLVREHNSRMASAAQRRTS